MGQLANGLCYQYILSVRGSLHALLMPLPSGKNQWKFDPRAVTYIALRRRVGVAMHT